MKLSRRKSRRRQKAEAMLREGKPEAVVKNFLIRENIKLGKSKKKAERNANSMMWWVKKFL